MGIPRQTAATIAVYNLMNTAASLFGCYAMWDQIPDNLPFWLISVAAGGTIGAVIGSKYLSDRGLRGVFALLLLASGLKLIGP